VVPQCENDGPDTLQTGCNPDAASCNPAAPESPARLAPLSDRERDVLALIGAGRSNPEFAAELFVSPSTVKSHVRHILAKLDLRDRPQAIVLRHGCGLFGKRTTR
jgi:DNA-binding CsgD family transcriptional regulator